MISKISILIAGLFLVAACGAAPEHIGRTTQPLSQRGPVIHLSKSYFCADAPNLWAGATVTLTTCDVSAEWGLTNAGYTLTHKIYPLAAPNLCIFDGSSGQTVVLTDCADAHSFTIANNELNDGFCIGSSSPGSNGTLTWGSCGASGFFDNWALEGFPAMMLTDLTFNGQTQVWEALHVGTSYVILDGLPQSPDVPYPNQVWTLVTNGTGTIITPQQDNFADWVYSNTNGSVRIGTLNPPSTSCIGGVGRTWELLTNTLSNEGAIEGFGGCPTPGWAYNPGGTTPVSDQTLTSSLSFTSYPIYCDTHAGGC